MHPATATTHRALATNTGGLRETNVLVMSVGVPSATILTETISIAQTGVRSRNVNPVREAGHVRSQITSCAGFVSQMRQARGASPQGAFRERAVGVLPEHD